MFIYAGPHSFCWISQVNYIPDQMEILLINLFNMCEKALLFSMYELKDQITKIPFINLACYDHML